MVCAMTLTTMTLQTSAGLSILVDDEQRSVPLKLSPATIAARHWPLGRPSALQLERAIDDVEMAIEQSGLAHAERDELRTNPHLCGLLPPAFYAPGVFSRNAVEAEFSRLVATAEAVTGLRPATVADGEAAAALLLLRELMHHLGFQSFRTIG
jgi:hypothetical protein